MHSPFKQLSLLDNNGIGTSRRIVHELLPDLNIDPEGPNSFRTVFHPEYTYEDFIGKLTPLSQDGKVQYSFRPGIFMQALAQAYNNVLSCQNQEEEEPER